MDPLTACLSANHPTTIDAAGSQQIGVLAALEFAWRVGEDIGIIL